jgi:hypothetical protein
MTPANKLTAIKVLHTAIWLVMAVATAYALTASLSDDFDAWFFVSVGLIGGEVLVLVARRFTCPLTTIAERYTDDRSPTFDIYLPRWVAKHNIRIFTAIFVLGLLANLLVRL